MKLSAISALAVMLLAAPACKEDAPARREPPPPAPTATGTNLCAGPPKAADPKNVAFFPEKAGSFCLDPNASDKAFGEGAAQPLDGICDLFDGECEIYKRHQVQRVVEGRYVDGGGSAATIDVYLSRFASRDAAYAMFTKRVVGDGDPGHPDTPDPIEGGGAAALGIGNAYVWKGAHLVEITFNDASASSAKQVQEKANTLLPPLVKAFAEKIPGEPDLPPAAAALPTAQRLDLGIRFLTGEMLGVEGTGAGAYGYYADGDKRWRVLSIVKDDAAQAKDVVATLKKLPGAVEEKHLGDGGVRIIVSDRGPKTAWIVARKGKAVLGVGDESRVLREGMSPEEHRQKTLSEDEKRDKLRALLSPAQ
jgi:hypothetical protein